MHLLPHSGSALPRHDAEHPLFFDSPLCVEATQNTDIPERGALPFPFLSFSFSHFFLSMVFLKKLIYLLPGPVKPMWTTTPPPACSGLPFTYALHAVCTGPFSLKLHPWAVLRNVRGFVISTFLSVLWYQSWKSFIWNKRFRDKGK